jgi:molybdenum cofactor biosynthesis protein B
MVAGGIMDEQTSTAMNVHLISVGESPQSGDRGSELALPIQTAGHRISGPESIEDNPQAIRAAVDGAIQAHRTDCVIVYGQDLEGLTEGMADVVADRIERRLAGFGELMRTMIAEDSPGAAVLSRACGGISNHTLLFALPCSAKVQSEAVRRLIVPALKHLQSQSASIPASGPILTPAARGWQAAVSAMGGTLVRNAWPSLPAPLADHGGIRSVLDSAGERGVLACANRRRYSVFGFPDLQRPTSKVLLTADGGRADFVVALHRFPNPVGIVGPGAPEVLTSHSAAVRTVCREIVGAPLQESGFEVFAVDQGKVFVQQQGAVASWDGKTLEDEGLPAQVRSSLVLRWSQR